MKIQKHFRQIKYKIFKKCNQIKIVGDIIFVNIRNIFGVCNLYTDRYILYTFVTFFNFSSFLCNILLHTGFVINIVGMRCKHFLTIN